MTYQSLLAETARYRGKWIPAPRGDLLKLPDHLPHYMMIPKESSTGLRPGKTVCIRGFPGVRRLREDLCGDLCPHSGAKALDLGLVAVETHHGPKDSVDQTSEPSPRLARGRPTCHAANCRQGWILSQRMRRTRT